MAGACGGGAVAQPSWPSSSPTTAIGQPLVRGPAQVCAKARTVNGVVPWAAASRATAVGRCLPSHSAVRYALTWG